MPRHTHRDRSLRTALLALALGAAAAGACSRAHDCRPGTLFLHVEFAPYSGVQRVFVEVMVAGEATRSNTFDVQPTGADSGGVQVNFDTYPAGKHADVVVRLEGASGTLATRNVSVELAGECLAADVSFGAADGGAGGRGGAAGTGSGGASGSSGASGTSAGGMSGGSGAAGTGSGGVAGAGGRGGGVAGAGGSSAGSGGVAGTGVAGASGRGGTGGGAGTGVAGASGRGGAGGGAGTGVAGASGRGGTGGCAATAENCFNYLDDDCDGNIDCMDTDCNTVGLCVALDPGQGQLGVILPNPQTPCPPNYAAATTINSGQVQAQCSSTCGCAQPATSCVAPFYDYPTYPACMADASAQPVGSSSTAFSCSVPNWHADANGYVFGVGVGTITPMYAGCTATGTSTATTPTWTTTSRFCATTLRGGGCAATAPSASPPSPTTRNAACWPPEAPPARQARSAPSGTPATRGRSRATRARAGKPTARAAPTSGWPSSPTRHARP